MRGGAGVAGGEFLVLLVLPLAATKVLGGLAEARGVLGLIVAQVLGLRNSRVLGLRNSRVLGLVKAGVLDVRRNSFALFANLPILRLLENRMSVNFRKEKKCWQRQVEN